MLLINVVILNLYEKDLVKAKEQAGRLLVFLVEDNLGFILASDVSNLKTLHLNSDFVPAIQSMLKTSEFSDLVIVNNSGEAVFREGFSGDKKHFALIHCRNPVCGG